MGTVPKLYVPTVEEMKACEGSFAFCDGGVCGPNPSKIGGTWAWCLVQDGKRVVSKHGFITPDYIGLDVVTNNISELYAMIQLLHSLPTGWVGTICSDSQCTLLRRRPGAAMKGVPPRFQKWLRDEYNRVIGTCRFVLLGGHPKPSELEAGCRKDGFLVSEHNVFCDEACTAVAERVKLDRKRVG